jgi:hypothetical protein
LVRAWSAGATKLLVLLVPISSRARRKTRRETKRSLDGRVVVRKAIK